MRMPAAPPTTPRTVLSIRSSRIRRQRLAPIAAAHGQFLAARERASQLQIGHVGAGDQQNANDRPEKKMKILAIIADRRIKESAGVDRASRIRSRVMPGQVTGHMIKVGPCLLQGHAGFEPAEGGETGMVIPLQDVLVGAQITERQVNLGLAYHLHFVRQNAYDFTRDRVDHQLLTDHLGRPAKAPFPKPFTDERHLRPTGHVLRFREIAAKDRLEANYPHHVPSHDARRRFVPAASRHRGSKGSSSQADKARDR